MATRVRGDERRGEDGDEGRGDNVRVVQIENAYFEKLKARLQHGHLSQNPVFVSEAEKPKNPGFVIYGDDGRPID